MPKRYARARKRILRWRYLADMAAGLSILLGAAVFIVAQNKLGFLYYFFVPVTAGAVVMGRKRGVLYALITVATMLILFAWRGLDWLLPGQTEAEKAVAATVWAFFLIVTGYLVGYVSEKGGNRALVAGLGGDTIAAVERERKRMSFDIHDGVAQSATTAQMQVEVLTILTANASPDVREEVDRLKQTIGGAVYEIRTMIGQLRPPPLGPQEYASTLTQLIEDVRNSSGIKVEFELTGDMAAHTDSMRICVYRIVQEALSNIEQHSEASRARVGVRATRDGVFLTVADDGIGFDAAAWSSGSLNGHVGLLGMQERAALLGGWTEIDSAPGEGTVVRAHIPGLRL